MSYFDENNLERIRWRCSLNLDKYFNKPLRGFYNEKYEYVITWYENHLLLDNSKTLVEVTFINLTTPTYISKNTGEECQSFFKITLPINSFIKFHSAVFGRMVSRNINSNLQSSKLPFQRVTD